MTTIRELRTEDRAAWEPLWQAYLTFYEESLPAAVTDDVFARLAGQAGDLAGYVAVDEDGALIGFTHIVVHPSTWTVDRYVYLEDLFVAPAQRGTGVGRALIEHVYALAGSRRVYWQTQVSNATARTLYDRIARDSGFMVYERPD